MASPLELVDALTIGLRIRRRRHELRLSQRELADESLVTYAYVSRLESGTRNASWRALASLADRLNTTGLELLTGRRDGPCPFCLRGGKHGSQD